MITGPLYAGNSINGSLSIFLTDCMHKLNIIQTVAIESTFDICIYWRFKVTAKCLSKVRVSFSN